MTAVDLAKIREWVQVSPASIDDDALGQVVDAELELQAGACRIPAPPADDPDWLPSWAVQALYRRVGRECAARGVPLGLADGEFGPARLLSYDAEITRLEGPHRKMVFA